MVKCFWDLVWGVQSVMTTSLIRFCGETTFGFRRSFRQFCLVMMSRWEPAGRKRNTRRN